MKLAILNLILLFWNQFRIVESAQGPAHERKGQRRYAVYLPANNLPRGAFQSPMIAFLWAMGR